MIFQNKFAMITFALCQSCFLILASTLHGRFIKTNKYTANNILIYAENSKTRIACLSSCAMVALCSMVAVSSVGTSEEKKAYLCQLYQLENNENTTETNQSDIEIWYEKGWEYRSPRCLLDFVSVGNGCYHISLEIVEWEESREYCESIGNGGHLAEFSDIMVSLKRICPLL